MASKQTRKAITKTVRFEVFKRDSFTCQYCGRKAPEAVLNVDHIKPVAKGGGNDLFNLITSCFDCNSGKSDRSLSDSSIIEKQRAQIEALEEKRQQLEMMLKWREEMSSLADMQIKVIDNRFWELSGKQYGLCDENIKDAKKLVKKYGVEKVLDAVDASFDSYGVFGDDGQMDLAVASKCWNMVGGILRVTHDNPDMKELYYIRGILRNRLNYVNERDCLAVLKQASGSGMPLDELKRISRQCRSWSAFKDQVYSYLGVE